MARSTSQNSDNGAQSDISEKAAQAKKNAARTAQDVEELAELSYDELRDQLELVKADLADLTAAMKRAGQQTARQAARRARRTGRRAVESAHDGYDYAADHVEDALESAEDFAKDRPALALGLAAGAGFLLAMVMSRR
jgi:ElaB/YqjD/DUF883 family membrane-anchored ribosome-binding protein